MPQTLSLIGRGHASAPQGYPGGQNSQSPQNQQPQTDANYQPRHQNYQHPTQPGGQFVGYKSQNSPNLGTVPTSVQGNGNFVGYPGQSYNQTQLPSGNGQESTQIERSKFEAAKNQDKHDHARYDQQSIVKHDNQINQSQPTKPYEQQSTNKHDQIAGQLSTGQNRHDQHHSSKFEQTNQQTPAVHQFKHEQHEIRSSAKYEHSSQFKHDGLSIGTTNFQQQYKQQEQSKHDGARDTKLEHIGQKYEQSQVVKHDHGAKFEPPSKLAEKPYEFDRLKVESDRKTMNFGECKSEDKTKPALPPKPSKPNPPPRLTHHDKCEVNGPDVLPEIKPPPITLNLR